MIDWLLGWLFVLVMAVLYLGGSFVIIYKMATNLWPWQSEPEEPDETEEGWDEEDD